MLEAAVSVQELAFASLSSPGMDGAGKLAGSSSRSGGNKTSSIMDALVELVVQESGAFSEKGRLLGGDYIFISIFFSQRPKVAYFLLGSLAFSCGTHNML